MLGKPRLSKNPLFRLVEEFKLQSHVILPGYVSSDELPAFYSAADLFVFPSLYEGFGLPPLEAMACGTPVVVSNSSSLPEVIGDSGVLVDPYNVTALADGMRRVLADTALQDDLRARGLKRAAEFSWERSARQTLEVYKQVLS
jgi:glycosyltransferase involved in cell wall biosynthesis